MPLTELNDSFQQNGHNTRKHGGVSLLRSRDYSMTSPYYAELTITTTCKPFIMFIDC